MTTTHAGARVSWLDAMSLAELDATVDRLRHLLATEYRTMSKEQRDDVATLLEYAVDERAKRSPHVPR